MTSTRTKIKKLIRTYNNIEFRTKLMNYVSGSEFAILYQFRDVFEIILEDDELLENYHKCTEEIDRCFENVVCILKILELEFECNMIKIEDFVKTEHFKNTLKQVDVITKHIYNLSHFGK